LLTFFSQYLKYYRKGIDTIALCVYNHYCPVTPDFSIKVLVGRIKRCENIIKVNLFPRLVRLAQEVVKMVKMTSLVAQTMLGDVPEDKRFWCHDGRYLKNLDELKDALEQMTDEVFHYHSSQEKTDFSNWVKDVIGDEKLSRDLLKSATQVEAAKAIADRVKWLKNKITPA